MKKLILSVILTLFFFNSSNCQDLKGFFSDPEFKQYYNDNINEFLKQKYDVKTLNSFLEDKQIDEVEFKSLYIAFGFQTQSEFESFSDKQTKRLKYLSEKYSITEKSFREAGDNGNPPNVLTYFTEAGGGEILPSLCRQKYANCMMIANGTAIAAHLACASLDLTVILGGLCHAAAMATHYAMMDNCRIEYLECEK